MYPAPSVIIFSVFSGLGFGLLVFLGLGVVQPAGGIAFFHWGLGYGLAVVGLLASTFHLGNPQRALLAFTQWRSSWLSREAWAAVAALLLLAPQALSDWLGLGLPRVFGGLGAIFSVGTVVCTAMIYAQMRSVPRWNHWTVPMSFLTFMLAGGALLAGQVTLASGALVVLASLLMIGFWLGDQQFTKRGQDLGTATGLGGIGEVTVFEQAHTAGNYLLREMIYVVGRKHAQKLRFIAILFAAIVPAILLMLNDSLLMIVLAAILHLLGTLAARWLFFAEAEHVVGLYYGQR